MEQRASLLIKEFIKSCKVNSHGLDVNEKVRKSLEDELADILQQSSSLGRDKALVAIKKQERSTDQQEIDKDIAIGVGIYLFLKRSKEIVQGLIDRLKKIVTDILEGGGDAEDAQDTLDDMLDYIPDTIAMTEVHTMVEREMWNVLKESKVEQVEWITEPGACPLCEENADASPINLGDTFPSGHEHPPAHPRCRCHTMIPEE